jgi:hypothetical protein
MSTARISARAAHDAATFLCNVSVIPTIDVSNVVTGLSRQAAGIGGMFEIDNINRHVHATLYMARFQREVVEELFLRIKKAVAEIEPIRLVHDGYFVTPGNYYEVSYRREPQLLTAHDKITRAVRSLRYTEATPVVEDYYGPYSAEQRANVRRHGYDLAGALYRPHITITRFPGLPSGEPPVSSTDLSFTATMIGVFQADQLGAARELLQVFDLGRAPTSG